MEHSRHQRRQLVSLIDDPDNRLIPPGGQVLLAIRFHFMLLLFLSMVRSRSFADQRHPLTRQLIMDDT